MYLHKISVNLEKFILWTKFAQESVNDNFEKVDTKFEMKIYQCTPAYTKF